MLYTLLDARNAVAKFVESGTCPNRQVVVDRINEACARLMAKANWTGTMMKIRFATTSNVIALPRGALSIQNVCIDTSPRQLFGTAYEFMENGPGEVGIEDGYGKDLIDMGDGWPTFFDIPPDDTKHLVAFSTAREDIGKQILVRGVDVRNMEICTSGVPGELVTIGWWQGGVEGVVNANSMPAQSTSEFRNITFVQKPVTVGYVSLYTYDITAVATTNHRMYFLAKYHPDETQPGYHRYRITAPDFENGSNVLCNVKMRAEPMTHDNDLLPIQNLYALKAAVMAIREENDKNAASAKEYWLTAMGLLNDQTIDARENGEMQLQIVDEFSLGSKANVV